MYVAQCFQPVLRLELMRYILGCCFFAVDVTGP